MPAIACTDCPLRCQPLFVPFTPRELAFMQRFKADEIDAAPGTTIVAEGAASPRLFTVLSGVGLRYKLLEDGRRQVVNFLLPGDFIGLQAGLMGEMKHSVEATSAMRLCVFRRSSLWSLFRTQPGRAYDVTWIAAMEEHFLGETVATLGQRSGTERIAWALLRLYERLRAVGVGEDGAVPLPYRQQDLADALGLSIVHTNKMLMRLRASGVLRWERGTLHLPDRAAVARLALVEREAPPQRPLI